MQEEFGYFMDWEGNARSVATPGHGFMADVISDRVQLRGLLDGLICWETDLLSELDLSMIDPCYSGDEY